jgi:hypothetical protein
VLQSVATVRSAPFVPKDVRVSGVVLVERTGALELVVRADQEVSGSGAVSTSTSTAGAAGSTSAEDSAAAGAGARHAAASEAAASRAAAGRGAPSHGASSRGATGGASASSGATGRASEASDAAKSQRRGKDQRAKKDARAAGATAPPPPPPGAATATTATAPGSKIAQTRALLRAVQEFLLTIESKEHWRADVENLRQELERRRDPRQRLELLDAFGRRLGGESREVAESFAKLRHELAAAGADPTAELLSVFHHLGRRR